MFRRFGEMEGARIHADDGRCGNVRTLYFDGESWEVRHFVVATGPSLAGPDVLFPPAAVREEAKSARAFVLRTFFTKEGVKNVPRAESDPPVAAQQRRARPGAAPYPVTGGAAETPVGIPATPKTSRALEGIEGDSNDKGLPKTGNPRLRGAEELRGYRVRGSDGEIGHVEDLVVDTEDWVVRYVVVDTRSWLPDKKVLVAASWISEVSWADAELSVCVDSIEVKEAPAWSPRTPIDRVYEEKLHAFYGRTPYWVWQQRKANRGEET